MPAATTVGTRLMARGMRSSDPAATQSRAMGTSRIRMTRYHGSPPMRTELRSCTSSPTTRTAAAVPRTMLIAAIVRRGFQGSSDMSQLYGEQAEQDLGGGHRGRRGREARQDDRAAPGLV